MNQERLTELLAKKVSGSIEPEELEELSHYPIDDKFKKITGELENIWQDTGNMRPSIETVEDQEWTKLEGKVGDKAATGVIHFPKVARIAAAIVAIVTIGVGVYLESNRKKAVEFRTGEHQRVDITLPDGSTVWLNQNSYLSYRPDFGTVVREVALEGEGFFEVQKDPDHLFRVATGDVFTEVLGTSFNIQAYSDRPEIVTTVRTGRVSFRLKNGPTHFLEAGTSGSYQRSTGKIVLAKGQDTNADAWKDRTLEFENLTLTQVIPVLEDYFGTKIHVSDPAILNCQITSTFQDPTIDEVLEVISITLNLEISRGSNSIQLTGQGCH